MQKQFGTTAGLLALLAIFLHTQFGPPEAAVPAAAARAAQTGQSAAASPAETSEFIEGPWLATQAYFLRPAGLLASANADRQAKLVQALFTAAGEPDSSQLRALLGMPETDSLPEMWSIVATVPNPAQTRMTLYLDAGIESLERSMQSAGWAFTQQWLPWTSRLDSTSGDVAARRRQPLRQQQAEDLPGILLFRAQPTGGSFASPKLLSVFLVPETATAGIAGAPFFAALHLANLLTSQDHAVGLLAPTFSGSFSSLTSLVLAWRNRHAGGDCRFSTNVYSGSASNIGYARAFERDTGLSFHGGIIDTPDYVAEACELLPLYGIATEDAALLKEDESGYSASFETPPSAARGTAAADTCALRTYVFPRDISHLRNAYQEAAGGARDPYASQPSSLNFSIRDPNTGDDSIPVFSNVQTPLTQDAIIDSIARDFNRRNTRVVFIAAANSLDTLFLMRVLRHESPNARILAENPHVLLIPAASRDDLSGALLLSTYPMFPDGESWLDTYQRKNRVVSPKEVLNFSDSRMQGVFNVSQLLLEDIAALPPGHQPDLRGYRGFQGGHPYPGIWLLTLNRFGFQPLEMQQHEWPRRSGSMGNLPCAEGKDCGWLKSDSGTVLPAFPGEIVPLRNWRVGAALVNISILLVCVVLLRCNLSPEARKPLWFALTEPAGPRLQALLGVCLSLTAFDWILIAPDLVPFRSFLQPDHPILLAFNMTCLLGLAAPLTVCAFLLMLLWRRARTGVSDHRLHFGIRSVLYTAAALVFFGEIVIRWYQSCFTPGAAAFFFRFRAMDLYSGSSPAMPLLILTLVFFSVALLYFKRYTLAGPGRPRVEFATAENDSPHAVLYQRRLASARDAIEEEILAPSTLGLWPSCARAAVGILFAACSFKLLGKYALAFERPGFNWMLLAELTVILFWMAIGCYDLILLWKRVNKMLDLVDLLPIEAAVERVAGEWPRRPIWTFRKSVSSARLNRQMRYALLGRLAALRNGSEKVAAAAASTSGVAVAVARSDWTTITTTTPESAAEDLEAFLRVVEDGEGAPAVVPRLRDTLSGKAMPGAYYALVRKDNYEKESARLAALVLKQDLRPSWRRSGMLDAARKADDAESFESQFQHCCADFVALHCCRFITYAIEHIQRIATCVSLVFVLLVVLFNSYSPEGPQLVARYLAALFLILGYVITRVFAQMERNPLLSRIARSQPGELNREFWIQLATLGGLPLLGVLSHLFPTLSQFLFQWVAPGMQALH